MHDDRQLYKKWLFPSILFVLFLSVWEIIVVALSIPSFLVPRPSTIVTTAYSVGWDVVYNTYLTTLESFLGFLFGSGFGVTVGILLSFSKNIEISLMPYIIALKTVPIIAVAPLFVIWFGYGITTKVLLASLICFFPVAIGTLSGLKNVDRSSLDLFESLSATYWQKFKWLLWPNALVQIFSSLKVSVIFAVIGAIVAEFAGAEGGVGFEILMASYHVDTPKMFVYIIMSAVIGMSLYGVIAAMEYYLIYWAHHNR